MTEFLYNPDLLEGGLIFDTHAHYDDDAFDSDRDTLLNNLKEWSVCGVINCACSKASAKATLALAHKYDFVYAAVGLHPEETAPLEDGWIIEAAADKKCVAIGEIGLDYHWDTVPRPIQQGNFKRQIELAKELNLPVIIHSRDAHADTLDIVRQYKPKGVMHCFSGSAETAKQLTDMGLFIGLGGAATFKNARKAIEIIEQTPLKYLLLETDAPYMAPVPYRGQRCHSAMIVNVARQIADIKGVSVRQVLDITKGNAERLFFK